MNVEVMRNGLLKYAIFSENGNKATDFHDFRYENIKNEAAASRIFIR